MLLKRLKHGLTWRSYKLRYLVQSQMLRWRDAVVDLWARQAVARRWQQRSERQVGHGLPSRLVISLTSFPDRYETLALTLRCLLTQSVKPDQIILWIAHEHQAALPSSVRQLFDQGVTLASCDNSLRSHNKYIHTRRLYPDAFIATADDDTYYWPTWLAELIAAYNPVERIIPCHRVHKVVTAIDGKPLAYRDWKWQTTETSASALIFPTGVGGILYPPHSLHEDVDQVDRILALCPSADDVWLYWMAQRNGYLFRRTARWRRLHHWRGSQETGLVWNNVFAGNANDQQIKAMIAAYGWLPGGLGQN